jgi:hypothetical protein
MPNHVINKLTFIGKKTDIKKLIIGIQGTQNCIDFNKIIPMPKELSDVTSPTKIVTQKEYEKELEEIEKRRITNPNDHWGFSHNLTQKMYNRYLKKFGAVDWYDWSRKNWGTKWNAYETVKDNNEITFQTAWSTPIPVITVLSRLFPNVVINLTWADEDAGYNTGKVNFVDGNTIMENIPKGGSKESYDIYFELWGGKEDFTLVDGEYIYREWAVE